MTVGELTVYLAYLNKFFKPVKDLATTTNAIAQAAVGAERVRAILDTDTVIQEKPDGLEPETLAGDIEFENVAFGYDPANPILTDVSFKIKPGQFVGIVGPTGSGKSTVVSLIPRFYDLQAGVNQDRRAECRRLQAEAAARPDRLCPAGDRVVSRNHR